MVRVRSVPAWPGLGDRGVVEDRLAAGVAVGDDDPRLPGERRLVLLFDAVLPAALAVDEAEQVRREARCRATADLRVDALGLRLERDREGRLGGDGARIWSAIVALDAVPRG